MCNWAITVSSFLFFQGQDIHSFNTGNILYNLFFGNSDCHSSNIYLFVRGFRQTDRQTDREKVPAGMDVTPRRANSKQTKQRQNPKDFSSEPPHKSCPGSRRPKCPVKTSRPGQLQTISAPKGPITVPPVPQLPTQGHGALQAATARAIKQQNHGDKRARSLTLAHKAHLGTTSSRPRRANTATTKPGSSTPTVGANPRKPAFFLLLHPFLSSTQNTSPPSSSPPPPPYSPSTAHKLASSFSASSQTPHTKSPPFTLCTQIPPFSTKRYLPSASFQQK